MAMNHLIKGKFNEISNFFPKLPDDISPSSFWIRKL